MVRIVDVDAHFLEPRDWLELTDPQLAAELPPMTHQESSAAIILGEAVARMPADERPHDLLELLPSGTRLHFDHFETLQPAHADHGHSDPFYDGAARMQFCRERGIDVQFLNPSYGYNAFMASLASGDSSIVSRARRAWNTFAAERMHGFTEHLKPVTQTNLLDVEWTITEMERMRGLGSRAFNLEVGVPGGRFLSHPDLEPVWSAAEDLGMAAYLHAGALFDALDVGWAARNGRGLSTFAAIRSIGATYNVSIPLLVAALALDGVFERHPGLVLIVAEAGHDWLPGLLRKLDLYVDRSVVDSDPMAFIDVNPRTQNPMVEARHMTGRGPQLPSGLSLRPSEHLRRQVRVAPLSGLAALDPLSNTLDRLPSDEMLVFSTDYPHPEGRTDAVEIFERELAGASDATREGFFGGNVTRLLAL